MAKLTNKDIEQRVYENSLQTCHYISGYENRYSMILLECEKHNIRFETRYENVGRSTRKHHVCPICQEEDLNKNKVSLVCDYCGNNFFKSASDVGKFNFCCRECKDAAQRISSGKEFADMRPTHYKNGAYVDYRGLALSAYDSKCSVCGWNEDVDILEVHHINSDRNDNSIDNLVILCPICHRKSTTHKYELVDRKTIIKK